MDFDLVVIGGGAGGVIASWRAATLGARVLLLEKTPRIGTKILISGGGKCNIAHAGPLDEVIRAFPPNEAAFLRPACYRFTNEQIMQLISSSGIELLTRADRRVFPKSATAKEVVAVLMGYLEESNVRICVESPVSEIERSPQGYRIRMGVFTSRKSQSFAPKRGYGAKNLLREAVTLKTEGADAWEGPEWLSVKAIVIATGGSSYPNSGTTGDAWKWLRGLGHSIVPVGPALAPIYLAEPLVERSGVALPDVRLKARSNGKVFAQAFGDILFTHQGISGPSTLQISRSVASQRAPATLEIDPMPETTLEDLGQTLEQWARGNSRTPIRKFVEQWVVPASMIDQVIAWSQVDPSTFASQFTRKDRNRLVQTLKAWPLGAVRTIPLERGEVVAGGVALDEVDPHTMMSRIHPNLFLCGELLDIAGPVGGYNLQAAFATGFVAGESAAKAVLSP